MTNNSSYESEMQESMARFTKYENVEIKNCPVEIANDIWNAAIEACADRLKKEFIAPDVIIQIIRKEKK